MTVGRAVNCVLVLALSACAVAADSTAPVLTLPCFQALDAMNFTFCYGLTTSAEARVGDEFEECKHFSNNFVLRNPGTGEETVNPDCYDVNKSCYYRRELNATFLEQRRLNCEAQNGTLIVYSFAFRLWERRPADDQYLPLSMQWLEQMDGLCLPRVCAVNDTAFLESSLMTAVSTELETAKDVLLEYILVNASVVVPGASPADSRLEQTRAARFELAQSGLPLTCQKIMTKALDGMPSMMSLDDLPMAVTASSPQCSLQHVLAADATADVSLNAPPFCEFYLTPTPATLRQSVELNCMNGKGVLYTLTEQRYYSNNRSALIHRDAAICWPPSFGNATQCDGAFAADLNTRAMQRLSFQSLSAYTMEPCAVRLSAANVSVLVTADNCPLFDPPRPEPTPTFSSSTAVPSSTAPVTSSSSTAPVTSSVPGSTTAVPSTSSSTAGASSVPATPASASQSSPSVALSSTSPPPNPAGAPAHSNAGRTAGIVIGSLAGAVLLAALFLLYRRRRLQKTFETGDTRRVELQSELAEVVRRV